MLKAPMGKRLLNSLFFFLENLGVGVWVGALVTFGFAVARPVFRSIPNLTTAGGITAHILQRINVIETTAAIMVAIAAVVFLVQADQRTPLRLAKTALALLMIAVFYYYGTVIMERMEHLRLVEIRDFDRLDTATRAFRDEFASLHRLYTRLAQANLFMGLGFLLLSAFERK